MTESCLDLLVLSVSDLGFVSFCSKSACQLSAPSPGMKEELQHKREETNHKGSHIVCTAHSICLCLSLVLSCDQRLLFSFFRSKCFERIEQKLVGLVGCGLPWPLSVGFGSRRVKAIMQ